MNETQPNNRFTIEWLSVVVALAMTGILAAIGVYRPSHVPEGATPRIQPMIAQAVGGFIGQLLMGTLVSYVVYRGRNRSQHAGTIAFVATVLVTGGLTILDQILK